MHALRVSHCRRLREENPTAFLQALVIMIRHSPKQDLKRETRLGNPTVAILSAVVTGDTVMQNYFMKRKRTDSHMITLAASTPSNQVTPTSTTSTPPCCMDKRRIISIQLMT